jgi:hypothetical protein
VRAALRATTFKRMSASWLGCRHGRESSWQDLARSEYGT